MRTSHFLSTLRIPVKGLSCNTIRWHGPYLSKAHRLYIVHSPAFDRPFLFTANPSQLPREFWSGTVCEAYLTRNLTDRSLSIVVAYVYLSVAGTYLLTFPHTDWYVGRQVNVSTPACLGHPFGGCSTSLSRPSFLFSVYSYAPCDLRFTTIQVNFWAFNTSQLL